MSAIARLAMRILDADSELLQWESQLCLHVSISDVETHSDISAKPKQQQSSLVNQTASMKYKTQFVSDQSCCWFGFGGCLIIFQEIKILLFVDILK